MAAREAYQDPRSGQRIKPGVKLADDYQARSLPVAKRRLDPAGVRLAMVLNDTLRAESEPTVHDRGVTGGDRLTIAAMPLHSARSSDSLSGPPRGRPRPRKRPDEVRELASLEEEQQRTSDRELPHLEVSIEDQEVRRHRPTPRDSENAAT